MTLHKMKFSAPALALLLALLLASGCAKQPPQGETGTTLPSETEEVQPPVLDLLADGGMTLVRAEGADELITKSASLLYRTMSALAGDDVFSIVTDWAKDETQIDQNARELVIGRTNRTASIELADSLKPGTFAIKITDRQILLVGWDDVASCDAVQYFIEHYLSGENALVEIGEQLLRIPVGLDYVSEEPQMIPDLLLNSTDSFTTIAKPIIPVPRTGNYRVMQGGCVTDRYAYFAMINTKDFPESAVESYIIKYDVATWKEVGRSESIVLDHANDITYVPDTNELYISNCYVDAKRISVLDADTLAFKEYKYLSGDKGCYAIEYNALRDRFVTGYGKTNMGIYDRELRNIGYNPGVNTTLITQGICADDRYIYHVLYSASSSSPEEKQHMIFVYDWDGNLITKVPLKIGSVEPENISLVGDTFYIACNNSDWTGGLVYEVKIVKE